MENVLPSRRSSKNGLIPLADRLAIFSFVVVDPLIEKPFEIRLSARVLPSHPQPRILMERFRTIRQIGVNDGQYACTSTSLSLLESWGQRVGVPFFRLLPTAHLRIHPSH